MPTLVPLISAAAHVVALLDRAGLVLEANADVTRDLGLGADLLGRDVRDLLRGMLGAGGPAAMDDALAAAVGGAPGRLRLELAGEARSVELSFVPYRQDDGSVAGVIVEAWDVTGYVREAERHAEDHERLRQVSATLGEVIWLGETRTGRILWASDALYEAWGLSRGAIALADVLARLHPDDRRRAVDVTARLAAGESVELDLRIRRPDGAWRDLLARLTPIDPAEGGGTAARYAAVALDVTERRAAERAQSRAERQFRELLEAIGLYAVTVDLDGRITFVNDAVTAATGWSRRDLRGREVASSVLGLDPLTGTATAAAGRIGALALWPDASLEHSVRRETELRCRDGSRRIVGWNLAPLRDETGRTIGVAAIGEDVTEARRVAAETEDLARLYRTVTLVARDVARTRTEDELYERVCRVLVEQGGYRLALVSRIDGDRLVPVVAHGAGSELVELAARPIGRDEGSATARALALGDVATVDDLVAGAAGTPWEPLVARFDLRSSATIGLLRDAQPVATLLVASERHGAFTARHAELLRTLADDIGLRLDAFADEARRRDAERRLEASESRYRQIVETTLEGIWIIDEGAATTYVNPRMAEMLGWTPAEMIGRSLRDFVDEEGWTDALANIERRAAGISEHRTFRFKRRDGTDLWARVATNPVFEGRRYIGSMAVVSDITDDRERDAELERAYDQRRRLIGRLVRAQEQERTRIAREVHDDSVQVMTAAAILVELLRDSVPDPTVRENLDQLSSTVRTSIARLRLLLFDLHPAALDRQGLAAAIRQLGQERRKLGAPPVRVVDETRTHPSGAIATVLFRIAQDAISNVIKHADATQITVTIRSRHGGTALAVADDGRGIEPAILRRRTGNLGLAAMRERAELTGGTLTIATERGRGTTVEAWVPNDEPGGANGNGNGDGNGDGNGAAPDPGGIEPRRLP